jgi:hypothetical protein
MSATRRLAILAILSSPLGRSAQEPPVLPGQRRPPPDPEKDEDTRLPNGKSQKDAISKEAHEEALKEVESLIQLAEDLRVELKRNGEFVVAVSSLKKTEEIEKLARKIRGKLKA